MDGYVRLNDLSAQHNDMHRKLFRMSLAILPDVTTTVPTTDTLQSGYGQFYEGTIGDNVERRLYFSLLGNLIYIELKQ